MLDLAEEKSENDVRRWIQKEGRTTWAGMAGMISQVEQNTGEKFLHGYDAEAGDSKANQMAVMEAYSSLVRAYALGQKGTGSKIAAGARVEAAQQARGFRRAIAAGTDGVSKSLREAWEFYKAALVTAAKVKKAHAGGGLGDVGAFLRESLHLDAEQAHAEGVAAEVDGMAAESGLKYTPPTPEAGGISLSLKKRILESDAVSLTGTEIDPFTEPLDMRDLRDKARKWAEENLPPAATNPEIGRIIISRAGIDSTLQHGSGPDKIKSVAAIPALLERGILIHKSPGAGDARPETHYVLAARLDLGGAHYVARLVVREDASGRRFYDHELSAVERLGRASQRGAASGEAGHTAPSRDSSKILDDLFRVKDAEGPSFSLSPTDRLAAVESALGRALDVDPEEKRRMFRAGQARLVRLGERWSGLKFTTAGDEVRPLVESRTKKSLDAEESVRAAMALDAALAARGMDARAAGRNKDSKDYAAWQRFQELKALLLQKGLDAAMAEELAGAASSKWRKDFVAAVEESISQAKTEAAAWRKETDKAIGRDHSPREALLRDMRTLDAILAVLPHEVRSRVGGYIKLASLGTDAARLKEIRRRINAVGTHLERYLKRENSAALGRLIDKSKPKADKPGESKRGKIGVEAHRVFKWVEEFSPLTIDELLGAKDANGDRKGGVLQNLEAARDARAADGVPGVVDHGLLELEEKLHTAELVGAFDEKTSAEQEAALTHLQDVYKTGRNGWLGVLEARAAGDAKAQRQILEKMAQELGVSLPHYVEPSIPAGADAATVETLRSDAMQAHAQAVATALVQQPPGTLARRQAKKAELSGKWKNLANKGRFNVISYAQTLDVLLGRDHPLAKEWERAAREAAAKKTDADRGRAVRFKRAVMEAFGEKRFTPAAQKLWDLRNTQTVEFTKYEGRGPKVEKEVPAEKIEAFIEGKINAEGLGVRADEALELADHWGDNRAAHAAGTARLRDKFSVIRQEPGTPTKTRISEAEAIGLTLLHAQTQYQKNFTANGYDTESMEQIEAGISEPMKKLRAFFAAEYGAEHAPLAQVFRELFGIDLPKIDNYSPARFERSGRESIPDPMGGSPMVDASFKDGFTKTRDPDHKAAPAVIDAIGTFHEHFGATEHWKAFSPAARTLSAVLGNLHVKNAIKAVHGENVASSVQAWQDAFAMGGLQARQGIGILNAFASRMGKSMALRALAGSVSTVAKNFLSSLEMSKRLSGKAWWSGAARVMTGKSTMSWMEALDTDVVQRRLNYGVEVRAALASSADRPTKRMALAEWMMERIGGADALGTAFGAAISFDHHYRELIDQKASPELARAEALLRMDEDVSRVNQPTEFIDKSLMELSASPAERLAFMMFGSEARKSFAIMNEAIWSKDMSKAEKTKAVAISWLALGLAESVISAAIRDALDPDDDEIFDEEHWGWRLWVQAATGIFAGLPFVRDVMSPTKARGVVVQVANTAVDIAQLFGGDEKTRDAFEAHPWRFSEDKLYTILHAIPSLAGVSRVVDTAFRSIDNFTTTDQERGEHQLELEKKARDAAKPPVDPERRKAEKANRKARRAAEVDAAAKRAEK